MKKLATIISIFVATATFSIAEASVQYFTSVQANRVVEFLNANPEILIYDANYPDNVDYVYTTDVWKEVSGLSYEVWIYGYHISTNEVVSTPVDLDYVWINNGGYPVSVAQLLGFNTPVVNVRFAWAVPVYRPWVRAPHPARYYRTYYYPHLRHHHYAHRPHHHAAPAPHHHHVAPAPSHHGYGTAHHNPAPTPNRGYNHNPSHSGANHGGNGPANRPSYNGGGHSGHDNHSGSVGNRTAPSHNSGMSHSSHSGSTRSHSTASMSHSSGMAHSSGSTTRSHGGSHSGGHGHGGGHHGNSRR